MARLVEPDRPEPGNLDGCQLPPPLFRRFRRDPGPALAQLRGRLGFTTRTGHVFYVGSSETLPPPLSSDEESSLLQVLPSGDPKVRSVLIELLPFYLPLGATLALITLLPEIPLWLPVDVLRPFT